MLYKPAVQIERNGRLKLADLRIVDLAENSQEGFARLLIGRWDGFDFSPENRVRDLSDRARIDRKKVAQREQ